MRWHRATETDRFGRSGTVYLSSDGRLKISDEGPAPWTLLDRVGLGWAAIGDYQTAHAAKYAAAHAPKRAA